MMSEQLTEVDFFSLKRIRLYIGLRGYINDDKFQFGFEVALDRFSVLLLKHSADDAQR